MDTHPDARRDIFITEQVVLYGIAPWRLSPHDQSMWSLDMTKTKNSRCEMRIVRLVFKVAETSNVYTARKVLRMRTVADGVDASALFQHRIIYGEGRVFDLVWVGRDSRYPASLLVSHEYSVPAVLTATHEPIYLNEVLAGLVPHGHKARAGVWLFVVFEEITFVLIHQLFFFFKSGDDDAVSDKERYQ